MIQWSNILKSRILDVCKDASLAVGEGEKGKYPSRFVSRASTLRVLVVLHTRNHSHFTDPNSDITGSLDGLKDEHSYQK